MNINFIKKNNINISEKKERIKKVQKENLQIIYGSGRTIKLGEYQTKIKEHFGEEGFNALCKIVENFLPCTICRKLLPIEFFYETNICQNRMNRSHKCKQCAIKYQKLLGTLTSAQIKDEIRNAV